MTNEPILVENDYQPSTSGEKFHQSSAMFKVLVGGLGSGKSRMAIEEVIALSAEHDEIEMFVMRKTMPANRDSTLNEFLKYIPEALGVYNKRTEQFNCVNGSKIMFRGLDEHTKIKSTNVAVIVMDEADEFSYDDFQTLKGRIRQVKRDGSPYPLHLILVLNPVDEDHWIYQQFVKNSSAYEEAGGLLVLHLSTYENEKNLPPGYIKSVTAGMTPQEIDRYIGGNWGTIVKGKPVYTDVFRADLHLKKWSIHSGLTLCRGWDFGFNHPACVFQLKDSLGRKNIDFEMLGTCETLDTFAKRVLEATKLRYGTLAVFDYCDPRGFDKSDKGLDDKSGSSVDILNSLGVMPIGERGVRAYVEPGIQMIRKALSTLIAGEPELTINPECLKIKAAFGGRYVRDDYGDVKKDGLYEHLMDAHRYIEYNDRSNSAVRQVMQTIANKRKAKTYNRITGYSR